MFRSAAQPREHFTGCTCSTGVCRAGKLDKK